MAVNPNLRQLWRRTITSGGQVGSGLNRATEFQDRAIANTAPLPNVSAPKPGVGPDDLTDLKNEISIAETGAPLRRVARGLAQEVGGSPVDLTVLNQPSVDPDTTPSDPTLQEPVVAPVVAPAPLPAPLGVAGGLATPIVGTPAINAMRAAYQQWLAGDRAISFEQAYGVTGLNAARAEAGIGAAGASELLGGVDTNARPPVVPPAPIPYQPTVTLDENGNEVIVDHSGDPTLINPPGPLPVFDSTGPVVAPAPLPAPVGTVLVGEPGGSVATIPPNEVVNAPIVPSDASLTPAQLMTKYGAGDPQELWQMLVNRGFSSADANRMAGITPAAQTGPILNAPKLPGLTPALQTTATGRIQALGPANIANMSTDQKYQLAGVTPGDTKGLYGAFTAAGYSLADAAKYSGYVPPNTLATGNPFVTTRVQGVIRQYDAALNELNAKTRGIYQAALRRMAEQGGEYGTPTAYESIARGIQSEGRAAMMDNLRRITTEKEEAVADAILDERNTNWERKDAYLAQIKEVNPQLYATLLGAEWRESMKEAGMSDEWIDATWVSVNTGFANDELDELYILDGKMRAGVDFTNADTKAKAVAAVQPYFKDAASATAFVDDWIGRNTATGSGAAGSNAQYVYNASSGTITDIKNTGVHYPERVVTFAEDYFATKEPAANSTVTKKAFIDALVAFSHERANRWLEKGVIDVGGLEDTWHAMGEDEEVIKQIANTIWTDFWAGVEG